MSSLVAKKNYTPPTAEFLANIRIDHLPDDVQLTFDKGMIWYDLTLERLCSDRSFHVVKLDPNGNVALATMVNAFETPDRGKNRIWEELHQTLVSQFGALPVPDIMDRVRGMIGIGHNQPSAPDFYRHNLGIAGIPRDVQVRFFDADKLKQRNYQILKTDPKGNVLHTAFVTARDALQTVEGDGRPRLAHVLIEQFGATPAIPQPACVPA